MHPTIPVIDMNDWAARRDVFVAGLREALSTVGFVAVRNPGVSTACLDAAYKAAEAYFKLPLDEKMKLCDVNINGQRGYIPGEKAKGAENKDIKEFFHMGKELTDEQLVRLKYAKNIWPDQPEFKPALQALFSAIEKYTVPLQEAMAEAIGQPKDLFTKMTDEGDVMLRAIHYFPNPPPGTEWAKEHTDVDLYAILPRATAAGLQVLNSAGTWVDVVVPECAFIINAGDMLENMTNGEFKSARHRVVAQQDNVERFSMVVFVHPRNDDQIGPLPESIARTGGIRKYADGTRFEFLAERLIELGLASTTMKEAYAKTEHPERQRAVGRASQLVLKEIIGYR